MDIMEFRYEDGDNGSYCIESAPVSEQAAILKMLAAVGPSDECIELVFRRSEN